MERILPSRSVCIAHHGMSIPLPPSSLYNPHRNPTAGERKTETVVNTEDFNSKSRITNSGEDGVQCVDFSLISPAEIESGEQVIDDQKIVSRPNRVACEFKSKSSTPEESPTPAAPAVRDECSSPLISGEGVDVTPEAAVHWMCVGRGRALQQHLSETHSSAGKRKMVASSNPPAHAKSSRRAKISLAIQFKGVSTPQQPVQLRSGALNVESEPKSITQSEVKTQESVPTSLSQTAVAQEMTSGTNLPRPPVRTVMAESEPKSIIPSKVETQESVPTAVAQEMTSGTILPSPPVTAEVYNDSECSGNDVKCKEKPDREDNMACSGNNLKCKEKPDREDNTADQEPVLTQASEQEELALSDCLALSESDTQKDDKKMTLPPLDGRMSELREQRSHNGTAGSSDEEEGEGECGGVRMGRSVAEIERTIGLHQRNIHRKTTELKRIQQKTRSMKEALAANLDSAEQERDNSDLHDSVSEEKTNSMKHVLDLNLEFTLNSMASEMDRSMYRSVAEQASSMRLDKLTSMELKNELELLEVNNQLKLAKEEMRLLKAKSFADHTDY